MPPALTFPVIAHIPTWATLILVANLIPLAHFYLLQSKLSNRAACGLGVLMLIVLPKLFPCENLIFELIMEGISSVFFALRVCEMATFDRSFNSNWTLAEYLEFLGTSENGRTRALAAQAHKSDSDLKHGHGKNWKLKWEPKTYWPHDRTLYFYLCVAFRIALTWTVYTFANAYLEKYPYDYNYQRDGWLLKVWDVRSVLENLMVAVQTFATIEICYTIGTLGIVSVLDAPYQPPMDAPYKSTSLRDFWSKRWNIAIKVTIHRLAFSPTLKLLSRTKGGFSTAKRNKWELGLATLAGFVFSAILHEYVVALILDGQSGTWENTIFFIGIGTMCVFSEWLGKWLHSHGFWPTGPAGWVLGWTGTTVVMLAMSPYFSGPYARDGKFLLFPVPLELKEIFKSII